MGYFVLAAPFFGLFAITFAVERRRMINAVLGNLLSLLAGLAIFGFTPMLLLIGKGTFPRPVEILLICLGIAVGYACGVFALFLLYSVVYGLISHRSGVDYTIVLGSRLIRGKVPPLLASPTAVSWSPTTSTPCAPR